MGLKELRYAAKVDRNAPPESQSNIHVRLSPPIQSTNANIYRIDGILTVSIAFSLASLLTI